MREVNSLVLLDKGIEGREDLRGDREPFKGKRAVERTEGLRGNRGYRVEK
jgi:hypothetical protein